MKIQNHKYTILAIVLFVGFILAFVIIFFATKVQAPASNPEQVVSAPISQPVSAPVKESNLDCSNPPDGFICYKDEQYGFGLQYSNALKFFKFEDSENLISSIGFGVQTDPPKSLLRDINISVYDNPSNLSIDDWISFYTYTDSNVKPPGLYRVESGKLINMKIISLNNINAITYVDTSGAYAFTPYLSVMFKHEDFMIRISVEKDERNIDLRVPYANTVSSLFVEDGNRHDIKINESLKQEILQLFN